MTTFAAFFLALVGSIMLLFAGAAIMAFGPSGEDRATFVAVIGGLGVVLVLVAVAM